MKRVRDRNTELEENSFKEAVRVSKLMPNQGTKPMPVDVL